MQELRGFKLVYTATPYSKFPLGLQAAFEQARELACELIRRGVNVYCPISYTHPLCEGRNGLDPLDHELWDRVNDPYLAVCDAIVVGMLDGWEKSRGVAREVRIYQKSGKPIYFLEPRTLTVMSQELAIERTLISKLEQTIDGEAL